MNVAKTNRSLNISSYFYVYITAASDSVCSYGDLCTSDGTVNIYISQLPPVTQLISFQCPSELIRCINQMLYQVLIRCIDQMLHQMRRLKQLCIRNSGRINTLPVPLLYLLHQLISGKLPSDHHDQVLNDILSTVHIQQTSYHHW